MKNQKVIESLVKRGIVVLAAHKKTNAPRGWRQENGRYGYKEEMNDPSLARYKATLRPQWLAAQHCGFYLGFGNLCCIDLDTKKTTIDVTTRLRDAIAKKFPGKVVIERTKSNGFHIYFLHSRLDNEPDLTGLGAANWIELYYHSRFIACWLSSTNLYNLEHGELTTINPLSDDEHVSLMGLLEGYRSKERTPKKIARKTKPKDAEELADIREKVLHYVSQIEAQEIDITGDNPKWFKIGMALAAEFGEEGFPFFQRLSVFSPTYNPDTIEDTYRRFVADDAKPRSTRIGIGSFLEICADAGLEAPDPGVDVPAVNAEAGIVMKFAKDGGMHVHVLKMVDGFRKLYNIRAIEGDLTGFYLFDSDSTHWKRITDSEVLNAINNFADLTTLNTKGKVAIRTLPYIEGMLKLLRIKTKITQFHPKKMVGDQVNINLLNGVLNVNTTSGAVSMDDHNPEYEFTSCLPYAYNPKAKCPYFDAWLETQVPDAEDRIIFLAFLASCFTNHRHDRGLMLAGPTATGKSTLVKIMVAVIGAENSGAISASTLFGISPQEASAQAATMEDKLLAFDMDAGPFRNEEMVLKVTEQSPIPGWWMGKARRAVSNYGRLVAAMNPRNSYSVYSAAIRRRFVVIPMNTPYEISTEVLPLLLVEAPGIFMRALREGLPKLIADRGLLAVSARQRGISDTFHTENNDTISWFKESGYCVLDPTNDKSNKLSRLRKLQLANHGIEVALMKSKELYESYRQWCESEEGIKPKQRKYFFNDLLLIRVSDEAVRIEGVTHRVVPVGIAKK